jgi:pyrroloquinoline quinone (PQQ) biosynthesis protein C
MDMPGSFPASSDSAPRPRGAPRDAVAHVQALSLAALRHRAVTHPYLVALGNGTLPDPRWALADFARHYAGYSASFPNYLTAVVSRLSSADHRRALLGNLSEESGHYGPAELAVLADHGIERQWVEGIAHPLLFRRFCEAVGGGSVSDADAVDDHVLCWRQLLMQVLTQGSAAEAVGAIGPGTENIVRTVYGHLVRAIDRVDHLAPQDAVFFRLHTLVDDDHQQVLQQIAIDLAATDAGRADLRRGMLKALQLRATFWDWLLARALDPAGADDVV